MAIGRVPGATGIQPSIVDAKGDLIAATAADSVSRLAVGSNGTVLTADSAEATGLKWATPTSVGLVRITGTTFSAAASVSLPNSTFTSTYKDYLVVFNADTNSSTGTYRLRMRASGADDTTSSYYGGFWKIPYTGSAAMIYQTTAGNEIQIMDSSPGVCFIMYVSNPQTTVRTAISFDSANPNGVERQAGIITHLSGTQFDALSIYMTSGNITGRYDVYGLAN